MGVNSVLLGLAFMALSRTVMGGDYCGSSSDYCINGCCDDGDTLSERCCYYDESYDSQGLSVGAWVGIIIVAVVIKVLFWTFCCWCRFRYRRSPGVIMVPAQPQSSVTVVNTSTTTNPVHVGYDQRAPGPQHQFVPMTGPMTPGMANTNPAHIGYNQQTRMDSNPAGPPTTQIVPPPYTA